LSTGARIRSFIVDELLDRVPASVDPLEVGLVDSLGIEQLIAFVEAEFGVVLDDDDVVAATFRSVDALAALVDAKGAGRGP
jgi:acyl carrier protein